jgi:hypothetical protein
MYYINPWVFYLIGLVTNVQIFCGCILIFGGIIWIISIFAGPAIIDEVTNTKEKEEACLKVFWKWMWRFPLIFLVCAVVTVTTPSESTIYKMMIASKISTDDVDHVMGKIDDVVNSIIENKEASNE